MPTNEIATNTHTVTVRVLWSWKTLAVLGALAIAFAASMYATDLWEQGQDADRTGRACASMGGVWRHIGAPPDTVLACLTTDGRFMDPGE